jgi:hypothetical protein
MLETADTVDVRHKNYNLELQASDGDSNIKISKK